MLNSGIGAVAALAVGFNVRNEGQNAAMNKHTLLVVFLVLINGRVLAQDPSHLPIVAPKDVGLSGSMLDLIDHVVNDGIKAGNMAGCVVAIGRRGKLAFLRAYGDRQVEPTRQRMDVDTIFDLASITKPVATATSIMLLWQDGKLELSDEYSKYFPGFAVHGKHDITIFQLLTHQGGLIPDNALSDFNDGPQMAFKRIFELSTIGQPGEKFVYSDVGYLLLAKLVHRLTGKNVDAFTRERVFRPLGMKDTGFLPGPALRSRCASNDQLAESGAWIKGQVHDPRARMLGGVAGHAGLFSTANDLSVFAQMLLNGGHFRSQQILLPETVRIMTDRYRVSSGMFGLGWDKYSAYSTNRGIQLSDSAFGHGGFTGTVLWIDPDADLFYIVLSNRLHPDGKGAINRIAGQIGTVAVSAIIPQQVAQPKRTAKTAQLATGLDVLVAEDFKRLHGERIGLITNHTGRDALGRSNIRLMVESSSVRLTTLFSPEHGIDGQLDIASIDDSVDKETGLAVFSLYGPAKKPSPAQLAKVDSLVFDIQDIGTRFYTYISTMGYVMQAAAEQQIPFYVLDRPNPIGGVAVEGAMLDKNHRSFVAFHNLPVRHGMTIGEIAYMFNQEMKLDLKLHVVEMKGWTRDQMFDQTGLSWVNPSPNLRNLNQALLYPGVGLLETTNLSVGRGTDTPFEVVGAPWLDGTAWANSLRELQVPGVSFVATTFTPRSSKFADQNCDGIQILITDRERIRSDHLGLALATTLKKMYPDRWDFDAYKPLLAHEVTWQAIGDHRKVREILSQQQLDLLPFHRRRQRFLIYPWR